MTVTGRSSDGRRPRTARPHLGLRTCVGCRRRDDRSALLRVVAQAAEDGVRVVPDRPARQPGRGAWLHPTGSCLSEAVRRRALGRALRLTAQPDLSDLEEWVATRDAGVTSAPDEPGADRRKRV